MVFRVEAVDCVLGVLQKCVVNRRHEKQIVLLFSGRYRIGFEFKPVGVFVQGLVFVEPNLRGGHKLS